MSRTVLVTGVRGYLGGHLAARARSGGWRVVGLTRDPRGVTDARSFRLGDAVSPDDLRGALALVHCAYDFTPVHRDDVWRVNVAGSERLFAAARAAGVPRVVCISSISAFPGCPSLYGQAKLAIEQHARACGATVLRPGLIFGDPPGAMFGRLVRSVAGHAVVPLVGNGAQIQFLVHADDLTDVVLRFCAGELPRPEGAVTVAHERPWPLRELLETIAAARGQKPRFVPIPWRVVWAGLKLGELLRVPLTFRSDSVVSLVHQNPAPDFGPLRQLGSAGALRSFAWEESGPSRI